MLMALGALLLPISSHAVEISTADIQPNMPISVDAMVTRFVAIDDAIDVIERWAVQPEAVTPSETCEFAAAPCGFGDHFALEIEVAAGQVVRAALDGESEGSVILFDASNNNPVNAHGTLRLERRNEGELTWTLVRSQSLRIDGLPSGSGGVLGLPCSAFAFLDDAAEPGLNAYRISADFVDDSNALQLIEIRSCRLTASTSGRVPR